METSNLNCCDWLLLSPVRSLSIKRIISIIIRESLVESAYDSNRSNLSSRFRSSSHHHGEGNIVVIRGINLFVSVMLADVVEGFISNNLAESFECNRLNLVSSKSRCKSKAELISLINWHQNFGVVKSGIGSIVGASKSLLFGSYLLGVVMVMSLVFKLNEIFLGGNHLESGHEIS
jgi:hypothetical protein